MSDETVVSEIGSGTEDAPQPVPAPKAAAKPAPKPEQLDPKQVSDADKAMKLWEYCCGCVDNGYEILVRDRSGLNTVIDINNI